MDAYSVVLAASEKPVSPSPNVVSKVAGATACKKVDLA